MPSGRSFGQRPAAVAFVVLLGVAVQNGVVLVAFLRQLRDQGWRSASAAPYGE